MTPMDDATLKTYLGNFVSGFADARQRRHLRKRGWIEYVRAIWLWKLTEVGYVEANRHGFIARSVL